MSALPGYDPANFYVWPAADDFAIHLSFDVVKELSAQISTAQGEGQPGELSGILIGRPMEKPVRATAIEYFQSIEAASEASDSHQKLAAAAAQIAAESDEYRAIGFFQMRRDGGLSLGSRDLETLSGLFSKTGNIALLLQAPPSGENEASLFYWQDGKAHPRELGFAFPFDAARLAGGDAARSFPKPIDGLQPAAAKTRPIPVVRPQRRRSAPPVLSRETVRWGRLLATAALVVFVIGAVQLATYSNRTMAAPPAATPANRTAQSSEVALLPAQSSPVSSTVQNGELGSPAPSRATLPASASSTDLGLMVVPRSHLLEIRWNRESAAIAASEKGEMQITEAGTTQTLPFDQIQLREGYIAYMPTTNEVSIRFEVTGKDGAMTSQSTQWVALP
jgi:hypothetical protein